DSPDEPPALYVTAARKVPSPLPSSTPTEPSQLLSAHSLATSRSRLPSPFTSATATDTGNIPPEPYTTAGWKVPSPLPNNTPTVLEPPFATIRSSLLSPFTSAIAIEAGQTGPELPPEP